MDRRSFLASLIGGLAAASFGTAALARPPLEPATTPGSPETPPQVDAEALDKANADYAQYYYRRRRRRWRRRYWRRRYYYYYRPRYYYRRRYYRPRYYYRRRYW